jgi:ion channel POLLUX/CASTOR
VQQTLAASTSRVVLDELDVPSYDHVIVCEPSAQDSAGADAQALLTLLHLRHIKHGCGADFSIVTEMNDPRNRDVAAVAEADDFVVSDNLMSLMLAQVSENKHLRVIVDDIFDPEGSDIYLKPAGDYVQTDTPVSFYTVVESARRRGEVAVGYRVYASAKDPVGNFGVVINPDKFLPVVLAVKDKVIVVAED